MKKNFLLLFLLTFSIGYSQSAAPTQPPRLPGDVISVFSGAYTNVAGTNYNPNWGQASNWPNNFAVTAYGGDDALRYQNSGAYQGTRLGSNINVTDINKLHVNIYSPTITSLRLFLIKTDGGTVEKFVTVPLTPNTWNTVNIDVNSTTFPGLDLTLIREIKYDNFGSNQILIIDNFYFWREAGSDPSPSISNFPAIAKVTGDVPFNLTQPTSNSPGAFTYSISPAGIATISGNTVTITGVGTATITANQAAVPGQFTAGSITTTLTVTPPAAPTPPTRNSFDVVSFYSNTYTPSSSPT